MPELLRCQCSIFRDIPCGEIATQEDLLCDTCRPHCGAAMGISTDHSRHVKIEDWHFSWSGLSARVSDGSSLRWL